MRDATAATPHRIARPDRLGALVTPQTLRRSIRTEGEGRKTIAPKKRAATPEPMSPP